jgi:hypothetical protein
VKWLVLTLAVVNGVFFGWGLHAGDISSESPDKALAPAAHVNRLLLLTEVDVAELRTRGSFDREVRAASEVDQGGKTPAALCFSIGPVQEGAEVENMRAWLEQRGGQASLRSGERRELALYWVFFPPLGSRDAARTRVAELTSKGIEDIFMIHRGDMANAVSLGVYSRKTSLERRLAELRKEGYDPEVTSRYRQKKATWYDVAFTPDFEFPGDRFTLTFPGAQAKTTACGAQFANLEPTVAPGRVAPPSTKAVGDSPTDLRSVNTKLSNPAQPTPKAAKAQDGSEIDAEVNKRG